MKSLMWIPMPTCPPFLKPLGLGLCLLFAGLASMAQPTNCSSSRYVVSTLQDNDQPGSLRNAMLCANAREGPDTIVFDLPLSPSGTYEIDLFRQLPTLTDAGTVIDASTQPGYEPGAIRLNGAAFDTLSFGFDINADQTEIYGFHLHGFLFGLRIQDAQEFVIGDVGRGNRIVGYQETGIFLFAIEGALSGRIQGNTIDGTNLNPAEPSLQGNTGIGIQSFSVPIISDLLIGGPEPGQGNLIGGNGFRQLGIITVGPGEIFGLNIYGNKIGTDESGRNPISDAAELNGDGISLLAINGGILSNVRIGGPEPGMANIIGFNQNGISLNTPVSETTISRNRIFCNFLSGIALEVDANDDIQPPLITSANTSFIAGLAGPEDSVEVFLNNDNACFAQGKIYLGTTQANEEGLWRLRGKFTVAEDERDFSLVRATATDFNGNTSAFSEPELMELIEPPQDSLDIPNAFTPNDDGANDRWQIQNLAELFPNNELQIFNRWGNQVYAARPFPAEGWDGRNEQGSVLDMGTYFYLIRLNEQERSRPPLKGTVTIVK